MILAYGARGASGWTLILGGLCFLYESCWWPNIWKLSTEEQSISPYDNINSVKRVVSPLRWLIFSMMNKIMTVKFFPTPLTMAELHRQHKNGTRLKWDKTIDLNKKNLHIWKLSQNCGFSVAWCQCPLFRHCTVGQGWSCTNPFIFSRVWINHSINHSSLCDGEVADWTVKRPWNTCLLRWLGENKGVSQGSKSAPIVSRLEEIKRHEKTPRKRNLITKTISIPCVVECRSRLHFSTSLINESVNNGRVMAPLSWSRTLQCKKQDCHYSICIRSPTSAKTSPGLSDL